MSDVVQTVTFDYADEWLLQPADVYNHKLMQASFAMAAGAFRDKEEDFNHKDDNILKFFSKTGFENPKTEDFNRITGIDTIGTGIASKRIGDVVIIAAAVSGNNYQNEWLSNLTIDDASRAEGFNNAAGKVTNRINDYIRENGISGRIRLWVSGYSRAAAIANIVAADAIDSGKFEAVFGYTIATPRTTKDPDAGRYTSIFNVINPFDPVPMVPFPEWGFQRYGQDLFLPSQEANSDYAERKVRADAYLMKAKGYPLHYNPLINSQLHTVLDFFLFFVSNSRSYRDTFQNGFVNLWQSRSPRLLLMDILNKITSLPEITSYQMKEFWKMLDYLLQVAYTGFHNQLFHPKNVYWNPALSIQENVMHEHYDEAYRSWIFSSDDPNLIFVEDPRYGHYSVYGPVAVEVYDEAWNFVLRVNENGDIIYDLSAVQDPAESEAGQSSAKLFASRQDQQTLIVLPMDQVFTVAVSSDTDTEIRLAYVEYSAKALRGNVGFVLYEKVEKGNAYFVEASSKEINSLSDEELLRYGVLKVEPWTNDIVYSPAAVTELENTGIFHPSPLIFITFSGLILAFALFIVVLSMIGAGKGVRAGVKKIRSLRRARDAGTGDNVDDPVEKEA